ncbi:hypothetical protein Pint_22199 [Pistacia integerrima]|uniref:Uncharacterized protein n=1 Tax=Pistacia integerrima TaxID=434235 RepID=A0ACC0YHP4_9ROSI|nr:hypothetical protein Pint_22199 [Pistacia integerrima]
MLLLTFKGMKSRTANTFYLHQIQIKLFILKQVEAITIEDVVAVKDPMGNPNLLLRAVASLYRPSILKICGKSNHDALRCWNRFDNSYQHESMPAALAAVQISDPLGTEWFPDTGATSHVTDFCWVYVKDLLSSQTLMVSTYSLHQPHHSALFSFWQQLAFEEIYGTDDWGIQI